MPPIRHQEHDACGVGFIYRPGSEPVIADALKALSAMEHRGATGADGKSGDGAGILTSIPWTLFASEGLSVDPGRSAVGVLYIPASAEITCRTAADRVFELSGFNVTCWRKVPTRPDVLGVLARSTCPSIFQVVLRVPHTLDDLKADQRLMVLRKQLINYVRSELGVDEFYIASLSTRTIVYKGMVTAPDLGRFYPDLTSCEFRSNWAVFHRRFSTNTLPRWALAQPFRTLAHNGEINTIIGNRNWMEAREPGLDHPAWKDVEGERQPVIFAQGSDSSNLDNVAEMIVSAGSSIDEALMQLIPEAHQNNPSLADNKEIGDFYSYYAALQEPWDGPALIVYSDGRSLGAIQDRNGLRPCRYTLYKSGAVVLGSETGILTIDNDEVVEKGRLGPGEMISLDLERNLLRKNIEMKSEAARRFPYGEWIREKRKLVESARFPDTPVMAHTELLQLQHAFGYGKEDLNPIIETMAIAGTEPIFSMGDDTPLAVLSLKPRPLFDYFKQGFAQVTNPPIDPHRERLVMSLDTFIGPRSNLLRPTREAAGTIKLTSPILSESELADIESAGEPFCTARLNMHFDAATMDLNHSLAEVCKWAEQAIESGNRILILSDQGVCPDRVTMPALLAVGALHHHLIRQGLRLEASIIVETGQCWNTHQFACLIGYGAQAVCPYLAFESVRHWFYSDAIQDSCAKSKNCHKQGSGPSTDERLAAFADLTVERAQANFRKSIEEGLLKVLSKMGISTLTSYTGAQIFECIGLGPNIVHQCFEGTVSRVGGLEVDEIAAEALRLHLTAFPDANPLSNKGTMKHRTGGEYHANNPALVRALHEALGMRALLRDTGGSAGSEAGSLTASTQQKPNQDDPETNHKRFETKFEEYAALVKDRPPLALRDLLEFNSDRDKIPVDEVESVESIVERFVTGGMSLGALSREAHETLAIAMNRIGAKSNSGEGGEDPLRYYPIDDVREDGTSPSFPGLKKLLPGDNAASAIRQVASARFGVTAEYLATARQLEIKIAQGAKPGEGGQLPAHKVSQYIADLRKAKPGMPLISPPPHHDIYSIEDLAQLIFDLRQVNPRAYISVKLVAGTGIGTIAAGVAKANADIIQISGHDGGTGAAPLSSIKNAGIPWELGLSEVHQVLINNGLRKRVLLRVDGGLRSGWEVVLAAMMGADEYGFGTIALVAAGCIMARICHTNNCPVGITTQKEALRKRFHGTPEPIVDFFTFIAEEVRHTLAQIGYRSIADVIGRTDLLRQKPVTTPSPWSQLDLRCLLNHTSARPDRESLVDAASSCSDVSAEPGSARSFDSPPHKNGATLDDKVLADESIQKAIAHNGSVNLEFEISNEDRSIGAKLSGFIVSHLEGNHFKGNINLSFKGAAGQSFGAFNIDNVAMTLTGEANDYVGKGMSGGEICIKAPDGPNASRCENVIMGNTCIYGATGGALFAAGRAGERFAVRNSGATAVIEGAGDHCCEYMTGGVVVVLGSVGRNFGAGMTGGVAFVLDDETFPQRFNDDGGKLLVRVPDHQSTMLKSLIETHSNKTNSSRAKSILENWHEIFPHFWMIVPESESTVMSGDELFDTNLAAADQVA